MNGSGLACLSCLCGLPVAAALMAGIPAVNELTPENLRIARDIVLALWCNHPGDDRLAAVFGLLAKLVVEEGENK